jgi:hypothetical protein
LDVRSVVFRHHHGRNVEFAVRQGGGPPSIYTRRLWSFWDRIECPTLVLRGADSDLLLRSTAVEMLGRNANTRLLEIPNCGHMPALLDAEQISIVSDWINARNIGLGCCPGPSRRRRQRPQRQSSRPAARTVEGDRMKGDSIKAP